MTLTKQALIDILVDREGFEKKTASKLVEKFFETLSVTLEKHEEIMITGFGRFNLLEKAARPGRNPKTLEEANISARTVTTFTASPLLLGAVNKAS